jgi:hypothetical protein
MNIILIPEIATARQSDLLRASARRRLATQALRTRPAGPSAWTRLRRDTDRIS